MIPEISTGHEGAAWRIELNRPDCGNLVTMEMVAALREAFRAAPAAAKLVVLSGRGADFCKGRDYESAPESARGSRAPSALEVRERMASPIVSLYGTIKEVSVPTIAVVRGAAYGFGCALSCGCDIVLAGAGSRFRLPEMGRGLPPTLAIAALMDRVTPRGLPYLVYSTAEVDSHAALRMGLASAVFPDDDLDGQVVKLVETIAAQPADAVKAVKEYLRFAPYMEPHGRADFAESLFASVLSSR
jgi:enoyl-CoA hydratase/carnithine racemase